MAIAESPELRPESLKPTALQLFLFSSVTQNPHRIHYDLPYVQWEGYPNLLVHGPLQWAVMASTVAEWFWGRGTLKKFSVRSVSPAYVNEELTVQGRVVEADGSLCTVEVWIEKGDGTKTCTGTAEIELKLEGGI